MGAIASPITSLTIVYSTDYSGVDQRKHQSSASLAFVRGIHRGPVNSPHKRPVTRKMFPFDDAIMSQNTVWYLDLRLGRGKIPAKLKKNQCNSHDDVMKLIHDMVFCMSGHIQGIHWSPLDSPLITQGASIAKPWFLFVLSWANCYEETIELPMIWNVLTVTWRYCNVCFVFSHGRISRGGAPPLIFFQIWFFYYNIV